MNISRYPNIDKFVNIRYIFLLARRAYSWLFQLAQMWKLLAPGVGLVGYQTGNQKPIHSYIHEREQAQGLKNPLARRPGLVISTFGLAEIISCMPDGLVKKYIGYWQTCLYSDIYLYEKCSFRDNVTIRFSYGILNLLVKSII
jgi:hypothetical protein